MASLFGKVSSQSMERLRNHEYQNMKEKLELLNQLAESYPEPRQCVWMLAEKDGKFREIGTNIVLQDRSEKMLEAILAEIRKQEGSKKYIIPVLVRLEPLGLVSYLKKAVASNKKEDRLLAMEIASQIKGSEKISHIFFILEEALRDPEEKIRYLAVHKLGFYTGKREIFFLLLPFLQDPCDKIRHAVIYSIAKIDSPDLVQPFLERLGKEPKKIEEVVIQTLTRLARTSDIDIEEKLIPVLADENSVSREAAAKLLGELPDKRNVVRKFLLYTRGIAFWLRERIYESVGTVAAGVADAVLELLDDQDECIRIDAIFLAAYMNDKRIIPGLVRIVDSKLDWWVRVAAIDILVKFRVPNLQDILRDHHEDKDLLWAIISAYGEIQDTGTIDYLKKFLKHPLGSIRLASLRSLATMTEKRPDILGWLQDIAETEADWVLRTEAQHILENKGRTVTARAKAKLNKEAVMSELKKLGISMVDPDEVIGALEEVEAEEPGELEAEAKIPTIEVRDDAEGPATPPVAEDIGVPEQPSPEPAPAASMPQEQMEMLQKLRNLQEKLQKSRGLTRTSGEEVIYASPKGPAEQPLVDPPTKKKITLHVSAIKRDSQKPEENPKGGS